MFRGVTIDTADDRERLAGQLERVRSLMLDGHWRDLATISAAVCGSEAGCSARLRDLRKPQFGGYQVDRRRVAGGLFEYRVTDARGLQYSLTTDRQMVSTGHDQGALFATPSHVPERVR